MASTIVLGCAGGAHAFTFSDIDTFYGSGANEAALVIDFADGSDPALLGYRFDGDKTHTDAIIDLAGSGSGLYARLGAFGFGNALLGLGLDRDGDGFGITEGIAFTDGVAFSPTNPVNIGAEPDGPTDPDDSYAEGWNTAFWSQWVSDDGNPFTRGGTGWSFGGGIDNNVLSDGSWFGFRYAPGFVSAPPTPAPGSAALAFVLASVCARRRRFAR